MTAQSISGVILYIDRELSTTFYQSSYNKTNQMH